MRTMVTINDIASLDEFRDMMLPVAQANYEYTVSLPPSAPGKHRINVAPELMLLLTADEFMRKLPKEYVVRTRQSNELLYSGRNVAIRKTIPRAVVIETLYKMKTIIMGDE